MEVVLNVVGKAKINFTDPNTGNHIEGFNIFLLEDIPSNFGSGQKGTKKFISSSSNISYGDIVIGSNKFNMNLNGQIISLVSK